MIHRKEPQSWNPQFKTRSQSSIDPLMMSRHKGGSVFTALESEPVIEAAGSSLMSDAGDD